VVIVNLDPWNTQSGWVELPLEDFGLPMSTPYKLADLLAGEVFTWIGRRNYVSLEPGTRPAHILRVRGDIPSRPAGQLRR
jgi:starch synthase (maltosyl-transferring)